MGKDGEKDENGRREVEIKRKRGKRVWKKKGERKEG